MAAIGTTGTDTLPGVSPEEYDAALDRYGWAEVVDGQLVLGPGDDVPHPFDNVHNYIANQLGNEVGRQWDVAAVSPGLWMISYGSDGRVLTARKPDVLAASADELLADAEFRGTPALVAEVWSPSNTVRDMLGKRRDYHDGGAEVLVEVQVLPVGRHVSVEWSVRDDRPGTWRRVVASTGSDELVVDGPQPFRIVPDDLLPVNRPGAG